MALYGQADNQQIIILFYFIEKVDPCGTGVVPPPLPLRLRAWIVSEKVIKADSYAAHMMPLSFHDNCQTPLVSFFP